MSMRAQAAAKAPPKYISDLQPGDLVIYVYGFAGNQRRVETVERVTPTQVVIGLSKFRKNPSNWASAIGDSYHRATIQIATPEKLAEVALEHLHKTLSEKMGRVAWGAVPLAKLQAMAAIINRVEE